MRVGYLTNQYPAKSHTFIRREILALQAEGVEVERYTIRRSQTALVEADDLSELQRTHNILATGIVRLVYGAIVTALCRPRRFFDAFRLAWRMGAKSGRGRLLHLAYVVEACTLLRLTNRHTIPHLHAHFGTNSTTVAMLCHRLGGPTYSFTVHGPDEFDRPEGLFLRQKVADATFAVAISQFGQSQLYRWCAVEDWSKVHIVHCGIDAKFKSEKPTPVPSRRRLLWIGRIDAVKGLPILLEACHRLALDGVEFEMVLAGDGPMRPETERRVDDLGLAGHVRFMGWVGDVEVRDLIEGSRALIVPSFGEGLPVVIMESFARGRPAIATRIAGIPELVVDGDTGWIVAPGSVDELAAAMREALEASPEALGAMGMLGRQRVLERHDVQVSARKLATLFRTNGGAAT